VPAGGARSDCQRCIKMKILC